MKFYIAGSISKDPNYKEKFAEAEKALAKLGHSILNPAWINAYPEFSYQDYLFISQAMQMKCNAVLFLHDWADSNGAMQEYERAHALNQDIYFDIGDVPSTTE